REINKIEEGYLTPRINGSKYYGSIGYWNHSQYDSVKKSFINYMPRLQAFCDQIANEGQCAEPAFGNLASAYLSWIKGDYKKGLKSLDALKGAKISARLNDQEQLLRLLLLSQSVTKLDDSTEHMLLPALTWLDKKVKHEIFLKRPGPPWYWEDYDLKYFSTSSRDFYAKVLAPIYLKQKDTARAALCILRSEKTNPHFYQGNEEPGPGFDMPDFWQTHLHSYHLKTIINWEKSSVKTPYLRLLTSGMDKNTMYSIYAICGTAYLREHKYGAAARAFSCIPSPKKEKKQRDIEPGDDLVGSVDPFIGNLHDYPKQYLAKGQRGYSPLTFAKTMAALEKKIKSDPDQAAGYYFKMANGLYNTSYYGNAWEFTAYNWAAADMARKPVYYYDNDYIQERTAEKYYLKARALSKDIEFKARCTFMAAKCTQKRVIYPVHPDYDGNKKNFDKQYKIYDRKVDLYQQKIQQNIYFTDLQQNYSKTKFYKLAVDECSYLRDFLSPEPIKKPNKLRVIVIDKNTSH
ncbi:MAG TPA: hypothetical protein VFE54_11460, partial [Mucilaginibacter sp.]|nr:hypothetical protein [Mucilaginibacter sp.]